MCVHRYMYISVTAEKIIMFYRENSENELQGTNR